MVRRIEALAACAVIGRPVWKVTPCRRWKVQVLPPSADDQLVASSGPTVSVAELYRVSVSYISLIAMMPSEYSVAGSHPSTITGVLVS